MLARCLEFLDQYKEEIVDFCLDESLYNDFTEGLLETKVLSLEDFEDIAETRDRVEHSFLTESHCLAGLLFSTLRQKIVEADECGLLPLMDLIIWCVPLTSLCLAMQSRFPMFLEEVEAQPPAGFDDW